jgi:hypothetical protein
VSAHVPDLGVLERAWLTVAERRGACVRRHALADTGQELLHVEVGDPRLPTVLLTAGVHGDEPAGPWALLALVRGDLLDPHFRYEIWPCTNPSGYVARTRANAQGHDVNRSFHDGGTTAEARAIVAATARSRFALAVDFHEDFEADGFYFYEPLATGVAPIGEAVLGELQRRALPLHGLTDGFDLGYRSWPAGRPRLEIGRVLSTPDVERGYGGWPLGTYLLAGRSERVLTFETPRGRPWEMRVRMHAIAAIVAIAQLRALLFSCTRDKKHVRFAMAARRAER